MTPLDEVLLEMVRMIPPGELASYGDLSALAAGLGFPCTARRVARALSMFGSDVPWWRVVQSAGTVADPLVDNATAHLRAEGVTVVGRRVPLEQVRWHPEPDSLRFALAGSLGGSPEPQTP